MVTDGAGIVDEIVEALNYRTDIAGDQRLPLPLVMGARLGDASGCPRRRSIDYLRACSLSFEPISGVAGGQFSREV